MANVGYKGVVRGKTVVLGDEADLPEGTGVLVTPLPSAKGSPQAILAALETSPAASHEAAEEFRRLIRDGKHLARFEDPFSRSQ
jgi:hypothetical protein